MNLTLAFSPCPNDTFIFDALVQGKIDTEGLQFEPVLEDVQQLNQWAMEGRYDITKISYGVYPQLAASYQILHSGSALGKGVGPLLIAHSNNKDIPVEEQWIALPGEQTTAHFLFSYAYPHAQQKLFMRYDAIEQFVLDGKGLGVIIHENRFTYAQKGLNRLCDLGSHWEQATALPIPLGGIVIKRNTPLIIKQKVDKLIRASLEYAYQHYPVLSEYVTRHAQEMSEVVMRQHIQLYVNNHSLDLGESGKHAIREMMRTLGFQEASKPYFVE